MKIPKIKVSFVVDVYKHNTDFPGLLSFRRVELTGYKAEDALLCRRGPMKRTRKMSERRQKIGKGGRKVVN